MSVKPHTHSPYDFSKLSIEEQMKLSREKISSKVQHSVNEHLALEAKKKLDEFRSLNVK